MDKKINNMKKIILGLIFGLSFISVKAQITTAQMLQNINDTVYQNTTHQITGTKLNGVMRTMVSYINGRGSVTGLTTNYIPLASSSTTIGNSAFRQLAGNLILPDNGYSGFISGSDTTDFRFQILNNPAPYYNSFLLATGWYKQQGFTMVGTRVYSRMWQVSNYTSRISSIELDSGALQFAATDSILFNAATYNFSQGTANKILYLDANKRLKPVTVGSGLSFSTGTLTATGGGTVTSIATTSPVLGGTITTTGTISVDTSKSEGRLATYHDNSLKLAKSSNLSDLSSVPTARVNLRDDKLTNGGNAAYNILSTDKTVYTGTAFTAPRTWTLPDASTVNAGYEIVIADFLQTITSTNTLTIAVQSGQKLNGTTNGTEVMSSQGTWRRLISDGVSGWTFDNGIVRLASTQTLTNKTLTDGLANTQSAADSTTKIATTAFVDKALDAQLASYNILMHANLNFTATAGASTWFMVDMNNVTAPTNNVQSNIALNFSPKIIYISSSDYPSVNGLTPKLRIRGNIFVNHTAPTGNFTFGLYPITAPASSGGAGLRSYTIGTVVTGSDGATQATPSADTNYNLVSSDFALPANGFYIIAIVNTATIAANSFVECTADLQITYK